MISKNLSSLMARTASSQIKAAKKEPATPESAESTSSRRNTQATPPTNDRSSTTADRLLANPSPLSRLSEQSGGPVAPEPRNNSPVIGSAGLSPLLFPRLTLDQVVDRSRSLHPAEFSRLIAQAQTGEPDIALAALGDTEASEPSNVSTSSDQAIADQIVEGVQSDLDAADEAAGSDPTPGALDEESSQALSENIANATENLERLDEIEDPEIREQVLTELNEEITRLGELLVYVDDESAVVAIDSLTRTTESLGSEQADLIAEPLARGLEKSLALNHPSVQRTRIFGESVIEGHGSLLVTRLTRFVDIDSPAFELLNNAALFGIGSVNADFNKALDARNAVEYLVAQFIFEWGDVLSEDELQLAVDRIWEENTGVTEELEAQSVRLATLFEGVGSLNPDGRLHAAGIGDSELWDEVQSVKANLEPFAYTGFGQEYIAQGVADDANGETNFISHLQSFASVIDSGVGKADTIANLIVRSVAVRGAAYVQSGDIDSAIELFEGLENQSGLLGFNDRDALEGLTDELRRFRDGELTAEQFADIFSQKAGDIDGKAFVDETSSVGRAFKLLGIGVGTAAVVTSFRNADDFQSYLEAGVGGAGLAGEISSLLPKGSNVAEFLGKFSKLAKLGPVFDTLAVVQAFNAGDIPQAGFAFAGLVGGFLVSSSSVGPVGTAIGAFLAVGATIGGFALHAYRQNRAEDDTETLFGQALQAAGFSLEDANLLRDVSGDTRRSVGIIFSQLAAANPDFTPRQLLDAFLDPGSAHGNIDASFAVDENGDLIVDLRKELIDAIESLPRSDNGYFTSDSVQQVAVLFEQYLGINVDPSGLDAVTSLDALDEEFDALDLNGDGQISKSELEQIVEDYDAQGPYFGIPTGADDDRPYVPRRLAEIARYFVSREALIDRLDVGHEGGHGNDKISRDDIQAIREENKALRIILENKDVFDVADQQDPSKADHEISIADLQAVQRGNYRQELKDAATFLLENDGFFELIDTSDPEDLRTPSGRNPDDQIGDRKLTFTELASALSGNNGVLRGT